LLRPWVAATSILFGALSPALAEGSAEPSATALIEAPGLAPEQIVEALRLHLDRQNGP
jgi:hypothetical protein